MWKRVISRWNGVRDLLCALKEVCVMTELCPSLSPGGASHSADGRRGLDRWVVHTLPQDWGWVLRMCIVGWGIGSCSFEGVSSNKVTKQAS